MFAAHPIAVLGDRFNPVVSIINANAIVKTIVSVAPFLLRI